MKISHVVYVGLLVLIPALVSPWLLPAAYLNLAGIVVQGEVTGKHESITISDDDSWQQVFEVTYRYRPIRSREVETGTDRVGLSLYSRLHSGSSVQVRYVPVPWLRSFRFAGSKLEESTWLSRIPHDSDRRRDVLEVGAVGSAILLAFIAWRRKTRFLILAATLAGATVFSGILPAGFLVFPLLFWAWRGSPGKGFGWVLLASMALSTAVLYWRIPWPTPMPPDPRREAAAVVRHVSTVTGIWSDGEGSQNVRQPFQMADLEFTPEGASESVHIIDRVDLDSVPGLTEGARIQVVYPLSNPRSGRIAGGNRTYAEQVLEYMLALTYGIGAVVAFVIFPVMFLLQRLVRSIPLLDAIVNHAESGPNVRFPPDDPRRKAMEACLRALREKQAQPGKQVWPKV